jgi:hypothetical protein
MVVKDEKKDDGKKDGKKIQSAENKDVMHLVNKKMEFFKDVIQRTILHAQRNKTHGILGISEVTSCIERLGALSKQIKDASESTNPKSTPDGEITRLIAQQTEKEIINQPHIWLWSHRRWKHKR